MVHPSGLNAVNSRAPDPADNPHRSLGRGMAFVASLLVLGMFYL